MNYRLKLTVIVAIVLVVLLARYSKRQAPSQLLTPVSRSGETSARGRGGGATHDLSLDEAAGGHTLRRHVDRTDEQLRERLESESNISAASTYTDRATAERVVATVLLQERVKIQHWLQSSDGHANLVLDYDGDAAHPIGRTLRRGESTPQPCSRANVVLKWDSPNAYHVLTSYPECT